MAQTPQKKSERPGGREQAGHQQNPPSKDSLAFKNIQTGQVSQDIKDDAHQLGQLPDPTSQRRLKRAELEKSIAAAKQKALEFKKAGKTQEAINLIREAKSLESQLEVLIEQEASHQFGFDFDDIVSLSVMQFQREKAKDTEIIEKLDMAIKLLTMNVEIGILSQEDYVANIQRRIEEHKRDLPSAKGISRQRLLAHIQLMKKQLSQEDQPNESVLQDTLFKAATTLLEQLRSAFAYLIQLGEAERAESLLRRAESLNTSLNLYNSNPAISLDLLLPQHITGLEQGERRKIVISLAKFSAERASLAKQRAVESLRIKDTNSAKQFKQVMLQCEDRTRELEASLQNPWQIPPKKTVKVITKSVLVTNSDLKPGELSLEFGKSSGLTDKRAYIVRITLGEDDLVAVTQRKYHTESKGIRRDVKLNLDSKAYQTLFKRKIKFEVLEYHRIRSHKTQGTGMLKLEPFAEKCSFFETVNIGKNGAAFGVALRIHQSLQKPEFASEIEEFQIVEPLTEPFRRTQSPERKKPAEVPRKAEERKQVAEGPKVALPPEISPLEVQDPSILSNLNSYEVLEVEGERLQKAILAARDQGSNPVGIIEKHREVMRKKMIIEAQVENGVISPDQYKSVLSDQVKHDMILARYFKEIGDRAKLEVVVNRVKMMKTELAEMEGTDS